MESKPNPTPLVVVLGETASGKSSLALYLARRFNGEIIAADSRTIYKGMDIGTAKPRGDEVTIVPHRLLDIAEIDHPLTVADFKRTAEGAINETTRAGKIPFLVGGSALYIDAMIYDFRFGPKADPIERSMLQSLTVEQLQDLLHERSIPLPFNERNKRHLIRHAEAYGELGKREALRPNTLLISIVTDREELKGRIAKRTAKMIQDGLTDEVAALVGRYGWEGILSQTIGYQEFRPYFEGEATIEDVERDITAATIKLAKRQRTWFKRNKSIHYIRKKEEAVDLVTTFLNKVPIAP